MSEEPWLVAFWRARKAHPRSGNRVEDRDDRLHLYQSRETRWHVLQSGQCRRAALMIYMMHISAEVADLSVSA